LGSAEGLKWTDLVVLSACETGLGKRGNGSLRNVLHHRCGIPSVIATLWQIPDAESAELMKSFWTELARGQDVAAGLAAAQRSMIARQQTEPAKYGDAHPYFWSAYGMSGISVTIQPRPDRDRK
jgi:CHAT domain-containing protein